MLFYLKLIISIFCQIKSLTQHLFIDWKGLKISEEYEIMKLYAKNSKRFCVIYTGEAMKRMLYTVLFPKVMHFFSQIVLCTSDLFFRCLCIHVYLQYIFKIMIYTLYIAVYCMLAVTMFMSLSLVPFALDAVWPLNESRPIMPPYPGYCFVELWEYFYKIFWHSIIVWEITIVRIVAHDCMFVTFVDHVCSMLALVG